MAKILLLEDKLTKVMNEIVKNVPEQFGGYDDGDADTDVLWQACRDAGLDCKDFDIDNGASKCVANIDGCDSVLKVPYSGVWYLDWDDEEGEYIEGSDYFEYFYGAKNSRNSRSDYCLTEYEKYMELKAAGLDVFFPKTEIFGECEAGCVIKQEKVKTWYEDKPKTSDVSEKKASEMGRYTNIPDEWLAAAIEYYGEELVQKLVTYCHDVDDTIDADVHYGNLGFRIGGGPVILDFSGFSS